MCVPVCSVLSPLAGGGEIFLVEQVQSVRGNKTHPEKGLWTPKSHVRKNQQRLVAAFQWLILERSYAVGSLG